MNPPDTGSVRARAVEVMILCGSGDDSMSTPLETVDSI